MRKTKLPASSKTSRRAVIRWSLRIGLSGLALYLVLRGIELDSVLEHAGNLKASALGIILPASAVTWWLRSLRLSLILKSPTSECPVLRSFQANAMGMLGNLFLPLRGGDFLRCAVLKRFLPHQSFARQVGILALERITDLGSILLVLAVSSLFIPGFLASGLVFYALLTFVACMFLLGLAHRWVIPFFRNLDIKSPLIRSAFVRLVVLYDNLNDGFNALNTREKALTFAGQTLVLRLAEGAAFWGFALAMGLPFGPLEGLVVFSFVALGTAIPAAPGFIGTYELMATTALMLLGIEHPQALAFALLAHGWQFLVWAVVGVSAVMTLPVDLRSFLGSIEKNSPQSAKQ